MRALARALVVGLLLAAAPAAAGQLDTTWTAPTANTDGSPLNDLASYRVYWVLFPQAPCPGTQFIDIAATGTTPSPATTVTAVLTGLTAGMSYTVQVTAVDTQGNQSACSTPATAVARADPLPIKPGQVSGVQFAYTPNVTPPPSTGTAAVYRLNENTGAVIGDTSGNGNHGTITAATWTPGKSGSALLFAGAGFVTIPDALALDIIGPGTISAWVRLTELGRWHGIIAKGNANTSAAHNYSIEVSNSNRAEFSIGNGTAALVVAPTQTIAQGVWTHLALTWDGTTVSGYLDGVLRASAIQNLTPAGNTSPLWIGQYGGGSDRTVGAIDDVRIYTRALSAAEIQQDMVAPTP